jgi:hypothetical protein
MSALSFKLTKVVQFGRVVMKRGVSKPGAIRNLSGTIKTSSNMLIFALFN